MADSSPSIFSRDGSGKGQALAFNEDGSGNSTTLTSSAGSMMRLVINGVNPQNSLTVIAGGFNCDVVDSGRGAVAGQPGMSDTIVIQLPSLIPGGHHMLQVFDNASKYIKPARVYIVVE